MTDTAQNGKPEIDAETFALGPRKPPQLRVVETPKTKLDFALYFLSKGFLILPVRPNEKRAFSKDGGGKPQFATPGHPLNGGTLRATNHAPTIKRWFRDYPVINYGLALGGRTCVDVDVRKGEHWQFELSVVMGFDETPDTLANGSANGGFHIFFEGETENKNKAFKSGADPSCIDIKAGKTAYVVGPGCTVDGKPYRLLRDLPIAPLPDFVRFSGAVDAAPTDATDTTAREVPPPLEVTVSALKYLAEHDKEASYGEAGRDAADEWSETADNFDPEMQDATWDSLKRAKGKVKTAASIVWRARQKGWTAIDIEFEDIFEAAANENQGSEPTSGAGAAQTGKSSTEPPAFEVRAYEWTEAEKIEPRQWLGRSHHHIREFVTVTASPGGKGKTSLALVEALEMVTGRRLLAEKPDTEPKAEQLRVYYWNGEDPLDEVRRRIQAACRHFGIKREEIEGRLFVGTGDDSKIMLAKESRQGLTIDEPVRDALIAELKAKRIDVFIADPFIRSHGISENDNVRIHAVCNVFREIARKAGVAVELLHHVRKTGGLEVTAEDMRGASSLHGAARSVRVINSMTKEEANSARVLPENRGAYFRLDNGKSNMMKAPAKASWFELNDVSLGNARANLAGDNVGVAGAWKWPDDPEAGLPADARQRAQEATREGKWRADSQADDWIGRPIGKALEIDPDCPVGGCHLQQLLKLWKAAGLFEEYVAKDKHRLDKKFLRPVAAPLHRGVQQGAAGAAN